MKKFVLIFSIFLLLSFSINTIAISASHFRTLSQGVHIVKDSLLADVSYNVENTSQYNKAVIMIIDSNKALQEYIILEPKATHNNLKPLHYDDTVVIVGNADINFL